MAGGAQTRATGAKTAMMFEVVFSRRCFFGWIRIWRIAGAVSVVTVVSNCPPRERRRIAPPLLTWRVIFFVRREGRRGAGVNKAAVTVDQWIKTAALYYRNRPPCNALNRDERVSAMLSLAMLLYNLLIIISMTKCPIRDKR